MNRRIRYLTLALIMGLLAIASVAQNPQPDGIREVRADSPEFPGRMASAGAEAGESRQ